MIKARQNHIKEVEVRIQDCKGKALRYDEVILDGSWKILAGNYAKLKQFLAKHRSMVESRGHLPYLPTGVGVSAHIELSRVLHNFLHATGTRIDNTRAFVRRKYGGTDFEAQYQEQVDRIFAKSEIAGFIKDLRNYSCHSGLPITRISGAWNPIYGSAVLVTFASDLVDDLETFKAHGRRYIERHPDGVPLENTADKYMEASKELRDWVLDAHRRHNVEAFEEFFELQRQLQERLAEAGYNPFKGDWPYPDADADAFTTAM